jgi:ribosomal 50S subunit-associated protein YjgA (DUF615 family)
MTKGIKIDEYTLTKIIVENNLRHTIIQIEKIRRRQFEDKDGREMKYLTKLLYHQEIEYERLMTWSRKDWDEYWDEWNRKNLF